MRDNWKTDRTGRTSMTGGTGVTSGASGATRDDTLEKLDGDALYQLWGSGNLSREICEQFKRDNDRKGDTPWKPYIDRELDKLLQGKLVDWSLLLTALRADTSLGPISTGEQVGEQVEEQPGGQVDGQPVGQTERQTAKSIKAKPSVIDLVEAGDVVTYVSYVDDNENYDVYIGVANVSARAAGTPRIDVSPRFILDRRSSLPAAHNIDEESIIRVERNGDVVWTHRNYKKILEGATKGESST